MNISFNPLVRVRTVTAFVNMPTERAQWQASLSQAKQQCDAIADAIEAQGYRVQSIRIVSNPFGEFINVSGIDSALADLLLQKKLGGNQAKNRQKAIDHHAGMGGLYLIHTPE